MTRRNFHAEFQEMMVEHAARDRRLTGMMQWLLLGETTLVSESFLDIVDEADLAVNIKEQYGLEPEGVQRAFIRCEELVMEGAKA